MILFLAWTVGRICEIISEAVVNEQYLNPLLHALVEGLRSEPRVATNVCWVSLVKSFVQPQFSWRNTSCCSDIFPGIIKPSQRICLLHNIEDHIDCFRLLCTYL